jgi:hypothetical protein
MPIARVERRRKPSPQPAGRGRGGGPRSADDITDLPHLVAPQPIDRSPLQTGTCPSTKHIRKIVIRPTPSYYRALSSITPVNPGLWHPVLPHGVTAQPSTRQPPCGLKSLLLAHLDTIGLQAPGSSVTDKQHGLPPRARHALAGGAYSEYTITASSVIATPPRAALTHPGSNFAEPRRNPCADLPRRPHCELTPPRQDLRQVLRSLHGCRSSSCRLVTPLTAQTIGFVASWITQSVLVGLEVFTAGFVVLLLVGRIVFNVVYVLVSPRGIDTDPRSSPSHLGRSSIGILSNSCPSGNPRHHSLDSPGFLTRSELHIQMRTRRSCSAGQSEHLKGIRSLSCDAGARGRHVAAARR